ncbi:MAG: hypothetical protein ACTHMB_17785 [Candidatus Binatia bacterium]
MNDTHKKSADVKRAIVHELIEYWINFGYLAFFLVAFTWYRRLILAEYQVRYTNYWFPLIEAAVLAKVIMIGDLLRLGQRMENKPLIVSAFFRTVMFSVWVGIFSVLEETVLGLLHGKGLANGVEEIASRGWYELVSRCVVIFVAFIPFFSFRELERVMGAEKLRTLFWRQRAPANAAVNSEKYRHVSTTCVKIEK